MRKREKIKLLLFDIINFEIFISVSLKEFSHEVLRLGRLRSLPPEGHESMLLFPDVDGFLQLHLTLQRGRCFL